MVTGEYNYTPEYIGNCLEASLQRLGVDRIDYYQLHNPTIDNMMAEDSYALLDKAKQDGKIAHWGVSVNTKEECDYVTEQGTAACLQMEYNIISCYGNCSFYMYFSTISYPNSSIKPTYEKII